MSIVRRYVVPNSANVLIGESILSLKKIHTLALNNSLQKKKKKKKKTGPSPEFSYRLCCAVEFTSRFTNKCQGENAVEQANINHNHHENNTRLCNTTLQVRVT